jgi:adenosine deaminase
LGVPISINPDDPSRFGYNHVTPDYYVAVHAFGFNLKDLKLLGVYSVMYGIIEEEEKKVMLERFEKRWQEWMEFFRSKYDK